MNIKEGYLKLLLFLYAIIWIITAINPINRVIWMQQGIPPAIFVLILVFTYKKFRFSNLSYTFIFIFLILHSIGAHYTYEGVPIFNTIKEQYGLMRNDYDRVVHFSFGLLFFLPLYEVLTRIFNIMKGWKALIITLFIMLSFKAAWELIEYWGVALIHHTVTLNIYLGEQGDSWDSIKDITCGFLGALVSFTVMSARMRFYKKEHQKEEKNFLQ